MRLVFATNNLHKLEEVRRVISPSLKVLNLRDIGCNDELQESGITLEENAMQKAMFVWKKYEVNCFADDTGLEIDALNGRPGVYSARYAGDECNVANNIKKVLSELEGEKKRNAKFRTVIALILNGEKYFFEGEMKGKIILHPKGNNGFGYDSVFAPETSQITFAEMNFEIKSSISHRAKAIKKLSEFLIQ